MIDAPPPMPPAQSIARQLQTCGLDEDAVTVTWHDAMEGVVIEVRKGARVAASQVPCIYTAAGSNLVIFKDDAQQAAYDGYAAEQARPELLASVTKQVAEMGLAKDFPRRSTYASLREYGDALARHAGFPAGVFQVSGRNVQVAFPMSNDGMEDFEKGRRGIAVAMYATALGDLDTMGVIGNASAAVPRR